jgi:hypothetical protein
VVLVSFMSVMFGLHLPQSVRVFLEEEPSNIHANEGKRETVRFMPFNLAAGVGG